MTDQNTEEMVALVKEHGGSIHGPNIETVSIPVDGFVSLLTAETAAKYTAAQKRYDEFMGVGDEPDVIERLRFFCSLAMRDQDWLDVEKFFIAVISERAALRARIEQLTIKANTAEKWKGIALAQDGDGRTVQQIETPLKEEIKQLMIDNAELHKNLAESNEWLAAANSKLARYEQMEPALHATNEMANDYGIAENEPLFTHPKE